MASKGHSIKYWIGHIFREAGEALDRTGSLLQGSHAYREQLNRSRRLMSFGQSKPTVHENVFVAPNATVIGNVELGTNSSVWYNAVLRGDVNKISVGENTNIQDRVVVHVSSEMGAEKATIIGNNVTIESGAIVHACKIEDESYIGIGATILDGAVVQKRSIVAPGSLVPPNKVVPSGELWAGVPAKLVRVLTEEEQNSITEKAQQILSLSHNHMEECQKNSEELLREIEETDLKEYRLQEYETELTSSKQ